MKQNFDYLLRPDLAARPYGRGRFSIPELWEKAKGLFARMMEVVGGEERVRAAGGLARRDRREIRGWLEPVEKLARAVLLARAVTHLLMTPEGRQLMRRTPKQAPWKPPPPPPPPPPRPGTTRIVRIPYPGWHTIARHWSPPPPPPPPREPSARPCAFRVLRITPPEPACAPAIRPRILDLFKDAAPAASRPPPRVARQDPLAAEAGPSRLERRIEALSHALANPERIVRRLARFLAGLPAGLLQPSTGNAAVGGLWRHGQSEFVDACFHLTRAIGAYQRLEPG